MKYFHNLTLLRIGARFSHQMINDSIVFYFFKFLAKYINRKRKLNEKIGNRMRKLAWA